MRVSFIIPVYNTNSALLNRCINSIEALTECEKEIIIIDDGSYAQDTLSYEVEIKKNKNVVLFQQENKGPSAARNIGLENASGNYIVFVDSDDYLISDNFDKILSKIKTIGYFDVLYFSHSDRCNNSCELVKCDSYKSLINNSQAKTYELDFWVIWGKIYNRDLFDTIRFNERIKYCEDVLLNRMINEENRISIGFDIQGIVHESNDNSLCNKFNPQASELFARTIEELEPYGKKGDGQFYIECIFKFYYGHVLPLQVFNVQNRKNVFMKNAEACSILRSEPYNHIFRQVKFKKLSNKRKIVYVLTMMGLIYVGYILL